MSETIANYVEERHAFGGPDPGKPAPGLMQVFCDDSGTPLMVDFLCPCGCGRTCPTHLLTPDMEGKKITGRHWRYSPGPSLRPSIRWTAGCYAHFTIKNGCVNMCGDSGRAP